MSLVSWNNICLAIATDGKDVSPSVEIGDANHEVEAAKQQTVAGEPGDVENQNNECTNDVTQTGGADAEHIIEVATDEPPDQNVVSPVPQEHPDPEPCGEDATLSVPDDLPVASSQKEESEALRSPNMDFPPPPPQEEDEPVVSSPDQEVISAAASSGRDSQLDEELHPGPLPDISSGMVDTDPSQAEHDPADTPPSDHNPMPEPTADPAVALDVEIPAPETPDDETTQDDDAQVSMSFLVYPYLTSVRLPALRIVSTVTCIRFLVWPWPRFQFSYSCRGFDIFRVLLRPPWKSQSVSQPSFPVRIIRDYIIACQCSIDDRRAELPLPNVLFQNFFHLY